jgi:hypothetical protein
LFANGDASFNGNVVIAKDVTINGRLNIQNYTNTNIINTTTTNYQLIVSEDLSLNGRLVVSSDATVNKRLFVSNDATINGLTIGQGNLVTNNNTAFGYNTLTVNSTGTFNTAISRSVLSYNTTGFYNTGIGGDALRLNIGGNFNNAVGTDALGQNTYGSNNTAVGRSALFSSNGSDNTAFGAYSGFSITDGSYNTFLGSNTDATNLLKIQYSTAIGYGATVDLSNTIVLGRSTEKTVIKGDASFNGKLFSNGDASFNGKLFANFDTSLNSRLVVGSDTTINKRLFVLGDVSFNGNLYANYAANTIPSSAIIGGVGSSSSTFTTDISANARLVVGSDVTVNKRLFVSGDASFNGNVNFPNNSINANCILYGINNNFSTFTYNYTGNANVTYDSNNFQLTQPTTTTALVTYSQIDLSINGNLRLGKYATVGNLAINKNVLVPSYSLDVSGAVSATTYYATSDYRIKSNVYVLDDYYSVDKLRPVTYNNTLSNKQDIGFIAHEVQQEYPFLVNGNKDDEEYQTLNYTGLIGILVKDIKDLKKENKELKEKVTAIEDKLNNAGL